LSFLPPTTTGVRGAAATAALVAVVLPAPIRFAIVCWCAPPSFPGDGNDAVEREDVEEPVQPLPNDDDDDDDDNDSRQSSISFASRTEDRTDTEPLVETLHCEEQRV